MKAPVSSRFAHTDGFTGLALYDDGDKGKIVTCGDDGDVRIWSSPDDESPIVFSTTDAGFAVSCWKNKAFVGTDHNSVETFSLPDGEPGKVVARFTATVNHLDVSRKGTFLVAGSGDMTIQIVNLEDGSSPPVKIDKAHSAPVLSVAIDPKEEFVVSSSCDGNVTVWTLQGKRVSSWQDLLPMSNDISLSKTLARIAWSPDGECVAVPLKGKITLYSRGDWKECKEMKVPDDKFLSTAAYSRCGRYLGAGSSDGRIFVWTVDNYKLVYDNSETKDHICGLIFSKSSKDIVAVDLKGRMISILDFQNTHETQDEPEDIDIDDELADNTENFLDKDAVADENDDPFNDDMDDFLGGDDGDEGNEFSISKIKASAGFIESEKEDLFVGVSKAKKIMRIEDDDDDITNDAASVSSIDTEKKGMIKPQIIHVPTPIKIPFTEPQNPFQPSSSPEHLQHRFMVWNNLGIIRNYYVEDDESEGIDIEFHDVSFHTGIHMRNQNGYAISTLGKDAAIFATPKRKESKDLSTIMCLHFSSWDNNKEWTTELPKGEAATTAAIGSGWFAIGTDMNALRVFTVGGVQRNVIDIGGQIIAISGHEDLLFVTYHCGIGLHGNQSIFYSILRIRAGTGIFPLISGEPLPLSPKSLLTWVGFSDEGTPAFSDSSHNLRILSGRLWTTFLRLKGEKDREKESEHFWVTGLSICSQQIRAIKCKGTTYPPTLPRPTVLILDAKIPLCEMDTEKSQLEDSLLRSILQNSLTKKMDKKGFDVEDYKDKSEKDIRENLMKLFAMCCKGDKEFRAAEYGGMMPSTHTIQIAIKFANKLRKMALTERLTAIGRKRLDEEEEGLEEDDDDFETFSKGTVIYSSVYSSLGLNGSQGGTPSSSSFLSKTGALFGNNGDNSEVEILDENPLLTKQRAEIQALTASTAYRNPFKKDGGTGTITSTLTTQEISKGSSSTSDNGKGLALIDAWKKPTERAGIEFNPKGTNKASARAPRNSKKDKSDKDGKTEKGKEERGGKKQPTLFAMTGKKGPKSPAEACDENSEEVPETSGDTELPGGETSLQKKKRKRSEETEEFSEDPTLDSEKKSRISSKLSMFARNSSKGESELPDV